MTSKTKNSTGYTGVSKKRKKFEAWISINGVRKFLGGFDTAQEASEVYQNARRNAPEPMQKTIPCSESKAKKQEAKEYTRKMLESIDLKRVPERLKPLYAVYIANLRSGEYSAMTVRIGGKDAI